MITVPEVVTKIVSESPYLSDGLTRDLINISALAREIRPQIESQLTKRVSHGSVVMALKRYSEQKSTISFKHPREYFGDMALKANLSAFSVQNSPRVSERIAALQEEGWRDQQAFITITKGIWVSTIVISNNLLHSVKKHLEGTHYTYEYDAIAAITLRFEDQHHETPGLIQYPLQLLAWRGISLYQIVSTMDELSLIVAEKDVERCFQALGPLRSDVNHEK